MKLPLFTGFLALSGALKATNLTTHTSTAECEEDVCMGGNCCLRAPDRANIRAIPPIYYFDWISSYRAPI